MECQCYLRHVHDKMADGETAFEKLLGNAGEASDAISAYTQVKMTDCYDCRKMNACVWQELDDQICYGQLTLWRDQQHNGTQLATKGCKD